MTLLPRISLNTVTRCYESTAVLFASGVHQIVVILGHFQPVGSFQQAITMAYTHYSGSEAWKSTEDQNYAFALGFKNWLQGDRRHSKVGYIAFLKVG